MLPSLAIFYDGPPAFAPRAAWVLDTLLTPLGRRAQLLSERDAAGACALAYAAAPVAGVPTIPLSAAALALFAAGRPLPPGAYAPRAAQGAAAPVTGAFPAAAPGFAATFDLVASAFALLACWDEHTTRRARPLRPPALQRQPVRRQPRAAHRRARRGRLQRAAARGVAAAPGGAGPGAAASGGLALDAAGDGDSSGASAYALALTHDIDNLWRWTPRGFAAAGYRGARALRARRWAALRQEVGDMREWATGHLPHRTDPFWTFPQLLGGEDARRVSSTFFVIARHTDRRDGNQPDVYRRLIPAALDMMRRGGREVGLHGNAEDRTGVAPLSLDRADLARRAQDTVAGIRYHYLRCLYHETLAYVEQAGFAYDTSLAFAEHEGFRCGISSPFHPYDLGNERPRELVELPLAIMDTSLLEPQYRHLDAAAAETACSEVLAKVRSAGGAARHPVAQQPLRPARGAWL